MFGLSLTYNYSQAAKRNLVYPNYAWIFYGLYPTRWWTEEVTRVPLEDCTDEQLEQFLFKSRGIMAHIVPEPNSLDSPSSAGIVSVVRIVLHNIIVWKC